MQLRSMMNIYEMYVDRMRSSIIGSIGKNKIYNQIRALNRDSFVVNVAEEETH